LTTHPPACLDCETANVVSQPGFKRDLIGHHQVEVSEVVGLQLSLHEAHQACLLAGTQDVAGAVEHIDAMNFKRLLVGWYASGPPREVAAELLKPLWTADPTGDLVRTLGCYLDHESSATTTTTAIVLGVHRTSRAVTTVVAIFQSSPMMKSYQNCPNDFRNLISPAPRRLG